MGINFSAILPEIILVVSSIFILILSLFKIPHRKYILGYLSLLVLIVSFISLFFLFRKPSHLGEFFIQDSFSFYFRGLLLFISFFVLLSAFEMFSSQSKRQGEFISLLLFSLCGLMMMTQATHLLSLYLSLELSSIPLYMIAGLKVNDPKSKEAIVKYFLLGSFASAVMIYGTSLIFASTDQLSFLQLSRMVRPEPLVILGSIMVLTCLSFKVAAFPFHFWAPDVYEGAPPISTAFISAGPKIGALVVFCRFVFMGIGSPMKLLFAYIILFIAILSMFVGNLSAIWQKEVKRMMAYSSIAQIGFMLLGVFVIALPTIFSSSISSSKELAYKGLIFYITSYSLANIGIFSLLSLVERVKKGTTLSHFYGLSKDYPEIALPMTILLLSLLGIPILGGFFSKFLIFSSLIQPSFFWILLVAIVNALISAFYYLEIVKAMYSPSLPKFYQIQVKIMGNPALITSFVCTFLILLLGIFPLFYQLLAWAILR